jgi:2-dehydropantoate 2-reductase
MTQGPIGMLGIKSSEAVILPGYVELATLAGQETYAVSQALGVNIEPVFGLTEKDFSGSVEEAIQTLFTTLVKHIGPHSRNAVVQDHSKGRRTEVDYLNGLVAQKGKDLGIPTPINNAITLLNQQIDLGKFPAEPQNLERIRSLI